MTASNYFHHALYVDTTQCNGCVHCVRVCPTEAIRVKSGCAVIEADKCVDCGNCFRVCPVKAIKVEQDDLSSQPEEAGIKVSKVCYVCLRFMIIVLFYI